MPRPNKNGLDYFPLDTDIFSDDKLKYIRARFDEKGELIVIKILCEIYRNGYYTEWNEDKSLIFSDSAGKNITANLANDVVHELVKRGFFDKGIFDRFGLLTSGGIQRRYITAIKDRKEVEIVFDYWLIDAPENKKNTTFFVSRAGNEEKRAGNSKNSAGNDTNKSKEKNNNIPPKSPEEKIAEILESGIFEMSENLRTAVTNWIAYKAEKNQNYKPTGLKSLLSEIKNNVKKHGEENVISLINQAMAANYQGIVWDKLQSNQTNYNNGQTQRRRDY